MPRRLRFNCVICLVCLIIATSAPGAPLHIAQQGKAVAVVCVDSAAAEAEDRTWEQRAAADLAHYIEVMCGAAPAVANDVNADGPLLVVGQLALRTEPSLQVALDQIKKQDPVLRADAIVVRRDGNRIYLAGTNDISHYHAVAWFLQQLGCRWYLPTEIGECIPDRPDIAIDELDHAYAPPFEMRGYWLSWNGAPHGAFPQRNFMNNVSVPSRHMLGGYVHDLMPEGKSHYNVAISDPATAAHIAAKLDADYAAGKNLSLSISDGLYESDYAGDAELQAGLMDKYFHKPSLADAFMVLYNGVARRLQAKHPESKSRLGFLAYANVTLPPQREIIAEPALFAYLAPIDIDPSHGMDHPESPPRHEYREMLYRWAEVMAGRVAIYDYDQGMLVWRDIPNPSHTVFRQDVQHYRKAGIVGFNTESRGAIATTFTNLYFRGQLMWDPDADVDAMLAEFYERYYGPTSEPMAKFWNAIYKAWDESVVTEHEYQIVPAIYTPALMAELAGYLDAAYGAIPKVNGRRSRNGALYVERMEMIRRMWAVLEGYMRMVYAAARDCDYAAAAEIGKQTMAARLELAEMNPTFTTRVVGKAAEPTEPGGSAAWWPGEVKQYMDLAALTDGTNGTLIRKLPLDWAFRRDPNDTGLAGNWARLPADLSYWEAHHREYNLVSRKDYPVTEWEMLSTDIYPQAQGIRHPDRHSYTGYMWYKTTIDLAEDEIAGGVHVMFPGLFNECWLYVNGALVGHRQINFMWWLTDYKFQWDVDLEGRLRAGSNDITVRCYNPHHFGGMMRRPFLYRATQ
ncbi:MAG: DUF4838 domain-containing protein [Lentisphaeria bacterium]